MRKLLYTFAALAGMLAVAASCQREAPEGTLQDGDLIDVSMNFTVDDGRAATKGIADGQTANKLTFLAYDEKGNYLLSMVPTNSGYENLSSRAGTVNLKVVKGMKYKFVFIASSENAKRNYFTFSGDNKTLTLNYSAIATAQKEDSDFFYHLENDFSFSASGEAKDVILKRPLAQLNVGSLEADFQVVANSGVNTDALKTGYVLTEIPNKLSLLDGNVSGSETVTLNPATRPSETLTVSGTNYAWVSTAYILVGDSGQNTDVTLNVDMTNMSGEALTSIERSITAVPLKRNYRTNILGNIFSIDAIFKVSVDNSFEATDDGNINVEYISVNSISDLATKLTENRTNTEAQTYVVTEAEATDGSTTDIVIPGNTQAASLVFQLNEIASEVTSIVIRDESVSGGEEVQYGNQITLEVPAGFDIANITVNAPYAHVVIKQGNITTLIASTGGDTIVVADGTSVGTLTVKCGNIRIEKGGKVTSIKRDSENSDEKTYVYLESLGDWTNIQDEKSEVIIPILNDIEISSSDLVVFNASELKTAVSSSNNNVVIYLKEGNYMMEGDYRFPANKSFSLIGTGEVVLGTKTGYGFSMDATVPGCEVTLKNMTIKNSPNKPNPVYIKNYLTLNLENVILENYAESNIYAIVLDAGNPINGAFPSDNVTTLNAKGVTIGEGMKVGLMGAPNSYYVNNGSITKNDDGSYSAVTYNHFNYDDTCVNIEGNVEAQRGGNTAYSTGSNLFVNGEALPPYTKDGEIAIKDEEGNWKIVTGYKYDSTKDEKDNGAALIAAIRSTAENDEPFFIGSGTYEMDGDNCRVSKTASGGSGNFDIRGLGDVVIRGGSLYGLNFNAPEPSVVTAKLSDLIVEGGIRCPIYCRGNVTLDLTNVSLRKGNTYTGDNAINLDAGSDKKEGQVLTVNCFNVDFEEGLKAEFIAWPYSPDGYDTMPSYIFFNYDAACNFPTDYYRVDSRNTGSGNIKINGVAVN